MKQPTISQARAICDAVKARGVIVLAFSKDNVAGASYGETKAECKQLARVMDDMILSIQMGDIQVWETCPDQADSWPDILRGIGRKTG